MSWQLVRLFTNPLLKINPLILLLLFYYWTNMQAISSYISKDPQLIPKEDKTDETIKAYEALKKHALHGMTYGSVTIHEEANQYSEPLLSRLGAGGSKQAIKISAGRALILPNMDVNSLEAIAERWGRIVDEEVRMSHLLSELGIPGLYHQKVFVSLKEFPQKMIPAYISESFTSLANRNWFIIDCKVLNCSTWVAGKDHLFSSQQDWYKLENWHSVLDKLITDVAKLVIYNIPTNMDSISTAVVKTSSEHQPNNYELRYFGFDYSSKYRELTIPEKKISSEIDVDVAEDVFKYILDHVFYNAFQYEGSRGELAAMQKKLVQYCKESVQLRIKSILTNLITATA